MANKRQYNYDEVIQEYEQISVEKGHPLKSREVNNYSELPSFSWFVDHGGLKKIRYDLGFELFDLGFCIDCTENPVSCGNNPDDCPLRNEAKLYYSDINYNSTTNFVEEKEKEKEKEKETREYNKIDLSDKRLEDVIKLKKQGMYWKDIAIELGIKETTLHRKVKRYMGDDWKNRGWRR